LKQFRTIAVENGVSESWIGRVESTIANHLKAWDEWECEAENATMEINGHAISDIRVEQTYKGNYHLLASIDGVERKFVINKKNADFENINPTSYLTEEKFTDLNEILEFALNKLPPIQKTVVLLRDYENYSYKEIAEITSLSETQVKVYIFRARNFMKDFIRKPELIL
jgi:RNA polymerase sigma factor (sigma-70 family)